MTGGSDVESELAGRVCVLAGGTGGIGTVLARQLHAERAALVLGYRRDRARAESVAAELRAVGPAPVALVGGDLAEAHTRDAILEAARALGVPYGLVVLAGDPARPRSGTPTQSEMETSFRDNHLGPILLARAFAEALAAAGTDGAIVLLATMQSVALFEGSVSYAAPKAALVHAARLMAKEWGGAKDVRVNVVAPGVTTAGMAQASIQSGKYDRFVAGGAIRRFGRAEDVARAIRFFLEPDGYVTGQLLVVDGGLTMRRDVLAC
jgi:NAD(P)-dependent dehydrogenase (short-subunit alcohol dehydrogenase family)